MFIKVFLNQLLKSLINPLVYNQYNVGTTQQLKQS